MKVLRARLRKRDSDIKDAMSVLVKEGVLSSQIVREGVRKELIWRGVLKEDSSWQITQQ